MTTSPSPAGAAPEHAAEPVLELRDAERARIRAEVRYAMVAAEAMRPPAKAVPDKPTSDKPWPERILGMLSNGFVLLLIGSAITSFLVPQFQRAYEARARAAALRQEAFAQFLLYSNSMVQEYYAILPLTLEAEIGKETYIKALNQISEVKLKRYDAYAKVQSLAVVFRGGDLASRSVVEAALEDYAVRVNQASAAIDDWLRGLYCTPVKREASPCARFDPLFDSYQSFVGVKATVLDVVNQRSEQVAATMVANIQASR